MPEESSSGCDAKVDGRATVAVAPGEQRRRDDKEFGGVGFGGRALSSRRREMRGHWRQRPHSFPAGEEGAGPLEETAMLRPCKGGGHDVTSGGGRVPFPQGRRTRGQTRCNSGAQTVARKQSAHRERRDAVMATAAWRRSGARRGDWKGSSRVTAARQPLARSNCCQAASTQAANTE